MKSNGAEPTVSDAGNGNYRVSFRTINGQHYTVFVSSKSELELLKRSIVNQEDLAYWISPQKFDPHEGKPGR
ncbi:MAG: hypothetical protein NT027_00210 [Proteobacteria bacterium]|nr:hypothetical protein [Pseudomonadota bacterium]